MGAQFPDDIMRKIVILLVLCIINSCTNKETELDLKWQPLFNGKDLKDWKVKISKHDLNDNYGNTFRVQDGNIQVRYDQYTQFDQQYGHLFYKQPFSYYLLAVEYRFVGEQAPGGEGWALRNSGAMIHGQTPESMTKDQDFPNSIEVQFLGGDGKNPRHTANLCTPGTEVIYYNNLLQKHCVDSWSETFTGDQWVRVEALVLGDSLVQHFANGELVLQYEKPQTEPKAGEKSGKLIKSGTISLQSESHPIDFRKVEIVNLEKYARDPEKLKLAVQQLLAEKRKPVQ